MKNTDSEYTTFTFNKEWYDKIMDFLNDHFGFKITLYVVVWFLPLCLVFTFIHEIGHVIAVLILHGQITNFHLFIFPFSFDFENAYVDFILKDATLVDYLGVACAGTLHTFIWAIIFFIIFYKYKFHSFIQTFFFIYFIAFGCDGFVYPLFDIFFFHKGDWFWIYTINSTFAGIMVLIFLTAVILFFLNARKIIDREGNIFLEEMPKIEED